MDIFLTVGGCFLTVGGSVFEVGWVFFEVSAANLRRILEVARTAARNLCAEGADPPKIFRSISPEPPHPFRQRASPFPPKSFYAFAAVLCKMVRARVEKEGDFLGKGRASFSKTKGFFLKNEGHRFLSTPRNFCKQLIFNTLGFRRKNHISPRWFCIIIRAKCA